MSSMRRRTLRWNFIKCNKFVNSIFVSSRRRFVWIVLKKPSCSYFIHRLISLFSPLSNRSGRSSYVYIMCRVSIFFSLLVFYFQSSSRRKLRTFMRVFSFLLFACLQMDLIIVVVFIVVLYVSLFLFECRGRERQQFFYLVLIRQPFTSLSLPFVCSSLLNHTMSFFFFSLCTSLRQ